MQLRPGGRYSNTRVKELYEKDIRYGTGGTMTMTSNYYTFDKTEPWTFTPRPNSQALTVALLDSNGNM